MDSPFVKHFKFNSFGPNRASEASVVPVDVQLEQLVVLCKQNKEKGKKSLSQMMCSALFHAPTQTSFISVWPMCETRHSHRNSSGGPFSHSQGVSLCHRSCHPHLTETETKLQENQVIVR